MVLSTGAAHVAALPMYDWPEVRAATDALWTALAAALAARGVAAPRALERRREAPEIWRDPALILSQTCGWPYATGLRENLRIVATPVYAVEGCEGPCYSSALIVRRDDCATSAADLAGRRPAVNSADSLSGCVALEEALRTAGVSSDLSQALKTGAHRASLRAVASGEADVAAIDAIAWRLAQDFEADAVAELKVLAFTPLRPALPFVTARSRNEEEAAAIRAALAQVLSGPESASIRAALHLAGIESLPEDAYAAESLRRGLPRPQTPRSQTPRPQTPRH
ncbi:phosphate/phosphite/phosphonate ABC transporter substrate-binding protein [Afifella sp. IM 167]|uniref:phosphate/phosphite/phosphonate ABC transporter substrate-binding protein n=1 Tax=Afifella sp. IM 167 TaxID=2033586 RepID=UPI001CD023A8|nr:PhnD/SsuA/transferrin family substrate-binding protein [Afifella sp. IM 167]MBZ8133994.1 hypothetical protein [Afifella sp. IM 167]